MDHWRVLFAQTLKSRHTYYEKYENYVYFHVFHIFILVIFSQNYITARYLHVSACYSYCVILHSFQALNIFGWTHIHLKATKSIQ